jgi:hypothetical protein
MWYGAIAQTYEEARWHRTWPGLTYHAPPTHEPQAAADCNDIYGALRPVRDSAGPSAGRRLDWTLRALRTHSPNSSPTLCHEAVDIEVCADDSAARALGSRT